MSKEAMKLALEALKKLGDFPHAFDECTNAIKSLEEALAKQEQGEQDNYQGSDAAKAAHMMDLYTALGVRWGDDPFAVIAKMRDQQPKQEQCEPVAATDIQISYEAHAEDPLDWNDLNFKECWHKGFADGFRAAETFHKIGVAK